MEKYLSLPRPGIENLSSLFEVKTIRDFIENQNGAGNVLHSHSHYEMIWLTQGTVTLYLELQPHNIKKNAVFCIKPNQLHCFQIGTDTDGYIFSFADSFFNAGEHELDWSGQASIIQLFSHSQLINMRTETESELSEIISKMMKEYENEYPFRMQLLRRYFRIFLIYLTRQFDDTSQPSYSTREKDIVEAFFKMVDRSFRTVKMVVDYAGKLSVTPNYLNGIIKKNTGYSASHHIRHRVVLEAKRMSRYSDAGMKEIAYNLGFSDIGHFSKFFKTVSGTNFSDFKKEGLGISLFVSPVYA